MRPPRGCRLRFTLRFANNFDHGVRFAKDNCAGPTERRPGIGARAGEECVIVNRLHLLRSRKSFYIWVSRGLDDRARKAMWLLCAVAFTLDCYFHLDLPNNYRNIAAEFQTHVFRIALANKKCPADIQIVRLRSICP